MMVVVANNLLKLKEGLATIIGEWDKIEGLGESEDKSGSSEGEQDNKENGYAIHS